MSSYQNPIGDPSPIEEESLRRYLLGDLNVDEREVLEQRLLTDEDYFQQLLLLETELLDDFAVGHLSAADRARLEKLLGDSQRQQSLRFSQALIKFARSRAPELTTRTRRTAYKVAIGLSLGSAALACGLLLFFRIHSLEARLAHLETESAGNLRNSEELRKEAAEAHRRTDEIAAGLTQQRAERVAEERPSTGNTSSKQGRGFVASERPYLAQLELSRGSVRSSSLPNQLILGATDGMVRLRLQVDGSRSDVYQATLQTAEGESLLTLSKLKLLKTSSGAVVDLSVPTDRLAAGDYLIRLSHSLTGGDSEYVGSYAFRVKRK